MPDHHATPSSASPEVLLDQWLDALNDSGRTSPPGPPEVVAEFADIARRYYDVLGMPHDAISYRALLKEGKGPIAPYGRNQVLTDLDQEIGNTMYTTITCDKHPRSATPQSVRAMRQAAPPPPLSATYVTAAIILIVALLGGIFVANHDWPNGTNDDELPYVAQPVLSEASPSAFSATCDVEPLTTEQIMAYVENPYSYMPHGFYKTVDPENAGDVPDMTEALHEHDLDLTLPEVPAGSDLRVPSEDEFEEALTVAKNYYACMANGTVGQAWALMNPAIVQHAVLITFPVYRDREEIVDYIESIRLQNVNHLAGENVYADNSPDGQRIYPNPDPRQARIARDDTARYLNDGDMIIFIGEESRDDEENIITVTGWSGEAAEGVSADIESGPGSMLVHSQSTNQWFFHGGVPSLGE